MSESDPIAVVTLPGLPSTKRLLASSIAVSARRRGPASLQARLPERGLRVEGVRQDSDRLAAYAHVCGFTLRDSVPATWPHVLAFPLQLQLMAAPDFPFAPVGMIHISNTLRLRRALKVTEPLTLEVRATNLQPHRRGVTLDLISLASVYGEEVWEGSSTYLVRGNPGEGAHEREAREARELAGDRGMPQTVARWLLPADLGRRYAGVSGDFNPIHLSGLTARALGFPRAIAHGMWTAAHSLAAVENRVGVAVQADFQFHKPILLPSRVDFGAEAIEGGQRVAVTSQDGSRVHFTGVFTTF